MIEDTYQQFLNTGFDHESAMRAAIIRASAPKPPEPRPRFFARLIATLKAALCRSHELPLDLHGARHCRIGIEESINGGKHRGLYV